MLRLREGAPDAEGFVGGAAAPAHAHGGLGDALQPGGGVADGGLDAHMLTERQGERLPE